MKIITQLRFYTVIVLLSFITITVKYFNLKKEFDDYQKNTLGIPGGDIQKAQLQDSIFILQTSLMRYEIAHDVLKERDSICAQKFEDILYKETE